MSFDYGNRVSISEKKKMDLYYTAKAIYLLNRAREMLERTKETDLVDAADDIGSILLALEYWERTHKPD